MTNNPLWIQRKAAGDIYDRMLNNDGSVVVQLIQAPAGMGKTYLARDLGTRLGSPTGYDPIRTGVLAWSGILDIYDPDTNSNHGIERRLIAAFAPDGVEFEEYYAARELYQAYYKSGIAGSGLEEQRHKIETEFAAGLRKVSAACRLTLVFDTIERLESAADPTQKGLDFFDDTASVMGWLVFQISQLQNAVVLLLGREVEHLAEVLRAGIAKANETRTGAPIEFSVVPLRQLDTSETAGFFAQRSQLYPRLAEVLTDELRDLIAARTQGNPLLLDLVLQTLLTTNDRIRLKTVLNDGKLEDLERDLVAYYKNSLHDGNRETLLQLLALARNGLFPELIEALEPARAAALLAELSRMEQLPFVKVRNISFPASTGQLAERRTYFLHDAMYAICDEVLFQPEQVKLDTQHIVDWYEREISAIEQTRESTTDKAVYSIKAADLYVQLLFYRMRVDPLEGYQWYLRVTDWAIRSVETSLDMRLRDALGLFLASAGPEDRRQPGQSLSSRIDRENVAILSPQFMEQYEIDSATLWMRRFSVRGKNDRARAVGDRFYPLTFERYHQHPADYALALADFLLWYGQGIMYSYQSTVALKHYQQALDILKSHYAAALHDHRQRNASLGTFAAWRLSSIAGRLYNNIGYTLWMYDGKYSWAIREFQRAVNLFREALIPEEQANSSDNMGRVYASLGFEIRATQLIKTGLRIRHELGLVYREALSHNSFAVALVKFDRFQQALQSADVALIKFRTAGVERGVGLGLLTRGEILRQMADSWREIDQTVEQALRNIDQAESDLREALRMFSAVKEPIREVQVRNALACCYRTRLSLLKRSESAAARANLDLVFSQGRILFQQSIRLAEEHGYLRHELYSRQALAMLFFGAERYDEAEKYLLEVKQRIPALYQIQTGQSLAVVAETDRIDAYYKVLGDVEQSLGAIAFDHGFRRNSDVTPRVRQSIGPDPVEAMLHYLLGVAYFSRYSDKSFVHRQVYSRIHARYQDCGPDIVCEILEDYLPAWQRDYDLPADLVRDLLADVFGTYEVPGAS